MRDQKPTWHPLLAAVEEEPARWVMRDPDGREYGRIELRRVQGELLRYKITRAGEVIGWSETLRGACACAHQAYLAAHGPGVSAAAPVPGDLERIARKLPPSW